MDKKDHQLNQEQLEHVAGGGGRIDKLASGLAAPGGLIDIEKRPSLALALKNALAAVANAPLAQKLAALKQAALAQGVECSDEALLALIKENDPSTLA
ncbi:MAG: hypothetical protein IJI40_04735 [Firmicutes bacterium]|nr:hypothetical protein [Bacillota bacterium]MBQ6606074.1 hypothetical protein [Bacillota bacterium]MBR0179415.1 hypothetical protein [Bacillota bacterium]